MSSARRTTPSTLDGNPESGTACRGDALFVAIQILHRRLLGSLPLDVPVTRSARASLRAGKDKLERVAWSADDVRPAEERCAARSFAVRASLATSLSHRIMLRLRN